MAGTLYLVATPIGNLQDLTFRAVETLKSVGIIACEDTRHTKKLLTHFGISNKLVSYHEHNEVERAEQLVESLRNGISVAVVSDAGTPGISDPSFRLVTRAIEAGIDVVPLPGAVAFVNAVAASGLATDSIFFGGFLPSKKGDRRRRLQETGSIPATLIFYESPRRLGEALTAMAEVFGGDRLGVVALELTKKFERTFRGPLGDLAQQFAEAETKGEAVILVAGAPHAEADPDEWRAALAEAMAEQPLRAAVDAIAARFGLKRKEVYDAALARKAQQ